MLVFVLQVIRLLTSYLYWCNRQTMCVSDAIHLGTPNTPFLFCIWYLFSKSLLYYQFNLTSPTVRIGLKILYSNFLFIQCDANVGIWFYIVKTAIQAEMCVASCVACVAFWSAIQVKSHSDKSNSTAKRRSCKVVIVYVLAFRYHDINLSFHPPKCSFCITRLREKTKSHCSRQDSRVFEFFTLFYSTFFIIKRCKTSKFSNHCIRINPILHQNYSLTSHKTVLLLIIQASAQLILTIYLSNQMLYCLFMSIQEDNYQPKVSLW